MLKIGKIIFSYPVLKYLAKVVHSTPRQLYDFEWLVLKAVKASFNNEFSNFRFNELFTSLFNIPESEKLFRPILDSLKDDNMLYISNYNDDLKLDNIYMKDIILTEKGKKILNRGYYPGNTADNNIELFYNPLSNTVSDFAEKFENNLSGIPVIDEDKIKSEMPPIQQMREYIEQCKEEGNLGKIYWLNNSINIEEIEILGEPVIGWSNVGRQLFVNENMEFQIPQCNKELALHAIKNYLLSNTEKKVDPNLPFISQEYTLESFKKIQSINEFTDSEIKCKQCANFIFKYSGETIIAPMVYELKSNSVPAINSNQKIIEKIKNNLSDSSKEKLNTLKAA